MVITNPELADKLLEILSSQKKYAYPQDLARLLKVDRDSVIDTLNEMIAFKEAWFKLHMTPDEYDPYSLILKQGYSEDIQKFKLNGGYVTIQKAKQLETKEQAHRSQLEIEHLKLEIEALRRLPLEQRRTRRLSLFATILSLILALIEVVRIVRELS